MNSQTFSFTGLGTADRSRALSMPMPSQPSLQEHQSAAANSLPVEQASSPAGAQVLVTRNLTKQYGDKTALADLNLTLNRGEVFGYIGPNGAGKTTTFRILAGLLAPTSGSASIAGEDVTGNSDRIKQLVGYLPDNFGVYPQLTVVEYLDFFTAAYNVPRHQRKQRIDRCLEIANAGAFAEKTMGALSRGMKQRVGIAKTLLHDPAVLILDEPAATLDPRARVQMRELLRELARQGKVVLISSHILPELADVCDRVGFISNGKMVACGTVADVLRRVRTHRVIEIQLLTEAEPVERIIQSCAGRWKAIETAQATDQSRGIARLRYAVEANDTQIAETLERLIQARVPVLSFSELSLDLEDAFMNLTQ